MIFNAAHVHLMLNHLPLFATLFALLLFAYGGRFASRQARFAAYIVFALSAIATIVVFLSGSSSEDSIEKVPGVAKDLIDAHEDAGKVSLALALFAGALGVCDWGVELRLRSLPRLLSIVTLASALVATFSFSYTALLGGQIHHPEVRSQSPRTSSESVHRN